MNRKANISVMILSVILIMIMPYVPHHHHDNEVCVEMSHSHNQHSDDSSCIKNIHPLLAKTASSPNAYNNKRIASPLALFKPDIVCITSGRDLLPHQHLPFYHSPHTRGIRALRAPPVICC